MIIVKKIVKTICLLYTLNLILITLNKYIPINIYTIMIVYLFDFFEYDKLGEFYQVV